MYNRNENLEMGDHTVLVPELDRNLEVLKAVLGEADDVPFRSFTIGGKVRAELFHNPTCRTGKSWITAS